FVSNEDAGQYVLTTIDGCITVINLNVSGNCDPGDTPISAEWKIGSSEYQEGNELENVNISADNGQEVKLSIVPNGISYKIILPTGGVIENLLGDYTIDYVNNDNAGTYILESNQGCSVSIDLSINTVVCDATTMRAEWSLDGGSTYNTAPDNNPITLDASTGDNVLLSMFPNSIDFTITYNGAEVYSGQGDYDLGNVTTSNSGDYIINAANGCSTTITLNVTDVTCDASTMRAEWSLDGGSTYNEAIDNLPVTIDAVTGNNVRLSMQPNNLNFTITYNGTEVYAGTGDYELGNVTTANSGDYIINAANGCSTTITLNVTDPVCDASTMKAEWSLDGGITYNEAIDNLPVTVPANTGDNVFLSMQPNNLNFTITYNGTEVYAGTGDYELGNVTTANSGDYIINAANGCSTTITLNVTDPVCDASTMKAEWSLDGGITYNEAIDNLPVTVPANTGDNVFLSMQPNGIDFTITYGGAEVYNGQGDYILGTVTTANSGDYLINAANGCSTTITLNVDCTAFTPNYTVNGTSNSGQTSITVTEGDSVQLGLVEGGNNYTITEPNGNVVNGSLNLGNITLSQQGNYIYTSNSGCTNNVNITVNELCPTGSVTPTYSINGTSGTPQNSITVTEGDNINLSLQQNGVNFTITQPNGTISNGDLNITSIALNQTGDYIYTTEVGCTATFNITVNELCPTGSVNPTYSINGTSGTPQNSITVTEGDNINLSLQQNGVNFTITQPNDTISNGDLNITSIALNQTGDYIYTTEVGCTTTFNITVNERCPTNGFTVQYTIDGAIGTGQDTITVIEGTPVVIGVEQDEIEYTVTLPNGIINSRPGALNLGNANINHTGEYTLTSTLGCSTSVTIIVSERCPVNGFTAQYNINGTVNSGLNTIEVNENSTLEIGITQENIDFTVTNPNGTLSNGVLTIDNVTSNHSGEYVLTSSAGCTTTLSVNVIPLTTNNTTALKDVKVYPNPVRDGNIYFSLEDFMNESLLINFYNIYGKLVSSNKIETNHDPEVSLNISILSEGTYIVEITRDKNNENAIKKVIKLKY
ncbi:hypothetical protein CLV91_3179, partial [Maribacter vaceletii]